MTISLDFDLGELPRVFPGHATARCPLEDKTDTIVRTAADFRWLAPFSAPVFVVEYNDDGHSTSVRESMP
jgi:hypothetical protein